MQTSLAHYGNTALYLLDSRWANEGKGMTRGELGRAMLMSRYHVTKLVQELVARHEVTVRKDGKKEIVYIFTTTTYSGKLAKQHLEVLHD